MSSTPKLDTANGGSGASNSVLGFGLHMPLGYVQIVAVDDDSETWADVPTDSILIEKTICKVRRSQYESLIQALRENAT